MTTPTWAAQQNGNTDASAGINQLLGKHADTEIYDGTLAVTVGAQLGGGGQLTGIGAHGWQQLSAGVQIDQPFVMSGTTISRVEIPAAILAGAGQDVQVQIQTDSAGLPSGTALATVVFPRELLTAAARSGLASSPAGSARANPALTTGLASGGVQPVPSQGGTYLPTAVNCAGAQVVLAGGYTGTAPIAATWVGQISGGQLGPWLSAPPMPAGLADVAGGYVGGNVILAGGYTGTAWETTVISAQLSATGALAGWTAQPSLPAAPVSPTGTAATVAGVDYMWVVDASIGSNTPSFTVAEVQNGNIQSWTTLPLPFPLVVNWVYLTALAVVNDHLVFVTWAGDAQTNPLLTVYVAPIGASGVPGAWTSVSSTVFTGESNAYVSACAAGDYAAIIAVGVSTAYQFAVPISPSGDVGRVAAPVAVSEPSVQVNQVLASQASTSAWTLFGFDNSGRGQTAMLAPVPALSVPFNLSGLTNAATYHLVFEAVDAGDVNHDTQLHVGTPAATPASTAHYKQGSGAWTAYPSGCAVPVSIYSGGTSGRPFHQWQDSGAAWSWCQWNGSTGQLLSIGEVVGTARSMAGCAYDPSGLLTTVTEVA